MKAFIAIVYIGSERISLLLPERIGRVIIFEDQSEYLLNALFSESFLRERYQMSRYSHTPVIRMHTQVMYDCSATVMTGQDHSYDLTIIHSSKAGVRIPLQVPGDALPGIIHGIQRSSTLLCAVP